MLGDVKGIHGSVLWDLTSLEDRHKNFMEHSKDNTFLFCARCSDHRSAKLGTKNSSEHCRVFPVTHWLPMHRSSCVGKNIC